MAGANIEATMLLCDSAQSVGGKLYLLGAGWTQISASTPPAAMGLAVKLEVAEEIAGKKLPLLARLVTLAGDPVADEETTVSFEGELELARRPGTDPEAPLGTVFALNAQFRGLRLEPGGYAWELSIDGDLVARSVFRVV
jgi:hypothetical protein